MREAAASRGLWGWGAWLPGLVIPVALFCFLYAPSLSFGFIWTDRTEIVQGLLVRELGELPAAFAEPMFRQTSSASGPQPYYRPIKVTAASLIEHLLGGGPGAYRAVALGIGSLTYLLLALLVGRLFANPWLGALVASLAAVHPAGIEDYAWPAGIDAALAKLFIVASLCATCVARDAGVRGHRAALCLLALALLALGLGSKESAVITPALAAVCLWQGRAGDWRFPRWDWVLVGSQLALVLGYLLVLRPLVLGSVDTGAPPIGDDYRLHALTVVSTWPERLAWLFVPWSSTTSDVVPLVRVVFAPKGIVALVLAAGSVVLALRAWRAGHGLWVLGIVWLWVSFLPTSGLLPLTHVRAERYLALSAWGAAMLEAALVLAVASRVDRRAARQVVAVGLSILLVGGLAIRTHERLPDWESDLTLFARDVGRDPLFREGRYVLAVALAEAGRNEEAAEQLMVLINLGDRFQGKFSYYPEASVYTFLCWVHLRLDRPGDTLETVGHLLDPGSPHLAALPAFFLCGAQTLEEAGQLPEALALYGALGELPALGQHPRVRLGFASVRERLGNRDEARRIFRDTPESLPGEEGYDALRRDLEGRLEWDRSHGP